MYRGQEVRTKRRNRVDLAVHLKHFHSGDRDYPASGSSRKWYHIIRGRGGSLLVNSWSPPFQLWGELLPHTKGFKYVGVLFTTKEKMELEMDRRCAAASAVLQALCQTVMVEREHSQKAKHSIYLSSYVPTITYGHELWVVMERMRLWP